MIDKPWPSVDKAVSSGERAPDLNIPQAADAKVGWAVVGLGELSLGQILPAFGAAKRSAVRGLVSGHLDKTRRVAAAYGVPQTAIYTYAEFDRINGDHRRQN